MRDTERWALLSDLLDIADSRPRPVSEAPVLGVIVLLTLLYVFC
jgi:hypothetical protein